MATIKESFKGHKGRKGQRGGSVGRNMTGFLHGPSGEVVRLRKGEGKYNPAMDANQGGYAPDASTNPPLGKNITKGTAADFPPIVPKTGASFLKAPKNLPTGPEPSSMQMGRKKQVGKLTAPESTMTKTQRPAGKITKLNPKEKRALRQQTVAKMKAIEKRRKGLGGNIKSATDPDAKLWQELSGTLGKYK